MPPSSPAAGAPFIPTRSGRAPWTRRRRLVVAVVGLLALVSLVIGVVSVAILSASLMDGLDQQVESAAERSSVVVGGGRPGADFTIGTPTASDVLNGPSQPPGTLALVYDGSSVTAGYTDDTGAVVGLSNDQITQLINGVNSALTQTYGYDPVTQMQETKTTLCKIAKA